MQGYKSEPFEARELLKPHIYSLRAKLEPDPAKPRYLMNVRGVGYTLRLDYTLLIQTPPQFPLQFPPKISLRLVSTVLHCRSIPILPWHSFSNTICKLAGTFPLFLHKHSHPTGAMV